MDSHRLADFIARFTIHQVPEKVVKASRYAVLDAIGVGPDGSALPASERSIDSPPVFPWKMNRLRPPFPNKPEMLQ
jgi:hypothetical protein